MGAKSNIEWTDASWTPIRARNLKTGKVGWYCEHSTTACEFCYAESMNKRLGTGLPFKPGHRKDVKLFLDDAMLLAPLRWKKPRMIFVCSMTDLFADFVPDEWIDRVFAVMGQCDENGLGHTFQVLTKRAARMRSYLNSRRAYKAWNDPRLATEAWPARNVWLGVSAERQQEADERIPHLLQTPAAIRFVSAEPLLGPLTLNFLNAGDRCVDALNGTARYGVRSRPNGPLDSSRLEPSAKLDWTIVGGESGAGARPMHPDWARCLRDRCAEAGVAYFFKQWGEWSGPRDGINVSRYHALCGLMAAPPHIEKDWARALDFFRKSKGVAGTAVVARVGKKAAGRLLDGIEHNAMPQRVTA